MAYANLSSSYPLSRSGKASSKARLRKEYTLRPEFKELWEKIRRKTRYAVKIDSEKLLQDVLAELDKVEVEPPRIAIMKGQVLVEEEASFKTIRIGERARAYPGIMHYRI